MTNNDILRRIRYMFDFDDAKMVEIFDKAGHRVLRGQVRDWLQKDDAPTWQTCEDVDLAAFLNGLINERRGPREGAQPEPEKRLSNNAILVKLKIALDLKAEDMQAIFQLADFPVRSNELSAYFRKPGHRNFRDCKEQVLRKFLQGAQLRYRTENETIKSDRSQR